MPIFKFNDYISDILEKALATNYVSFAEEFREFLGDDEFFVLLSGYFCEDRLKYVFLDLESLGDEGAWVTI